MANIYVPFYECNSTGTAILLDAHEHMSTTNSLAYVSVESVDEEAGCYFSRQKLPLLPSLFSSTTTLNETRYFLITLSTGVTYQTAVHMKKAVDSVSPGKFSEWSMESLRGKVVRIARDAIVKKRNGRPDLDLLAWWLAFLDIGLQPTIQTRDQGILESIRTLSPSLAN